MSRRSLAALAVVALLGCTASLPTAPGLVAAPRRSLRAALATQADVAHPRERLALVTVRQSSARSRA